MYEYTAKVLVQLADVMPCIIRKAWRDKLLSDCGVHFECGLLDFLGPPEDACSGRGNFDTYNFEAINDPKLLFACLISIICSSKSSVFISSSINLFNDRQGEICILSREYQYVIFELAFFS